MSTDLKKEIQIPDLWFDFYARLIPGATFVSSVRLLSLGNSKVPDLNEIFVLLGVAYFVALLTQPVSSRIVMGLENMIEGRMKVNTIATQHFLGRTSRESMILSKMGGESTMYAQLALLTIVFYLQNKFHAIPRFSYIEFTFGLGTCAGIFVFFIVWAMEVVHRRGLRTRKIDKVRSAVNPDASE